MIRNRILAMGMLFLLVGACFGGVGCQVYGPPPATVAFVDVERYMGLWYEIASNPVFFNANLVGVTAEYALQEDGTVSVVNRGFVGSVDGEEQQIEGTARVVDAETNSKLAVSFPSVLGGLFEGEYWIVVLDSENYTYAVVTDSRQSTLFILYREAAMPTELYEAILDELAALGVDTSRLRLTGALTD